MKTTKKQLNEMQKVAKVVSDTVSAIVKEQSKETIEVTINDKGVIVNKETGKHHFENIDIDEMKQISKEKKSREIVVGLKFGTSAPTIKIQLREQGFKLSNGLVKDAEMVRTHLLALKDIRILNDKQLMKCFKKLSRQISQRVVDSVIQEDETAIHIKTKEVN